MAKIKGVQSLSHLLVRLKRTGMATGKGAVLMLVFFPVSLCNKRETKLEVWSSDQATAPTCHKTASVMLGGCRKLHQTFAWLPAARYLCKPCL